MLILGIETATSQVSVAIGGHEGVLGLFEVCRGRRHAETLAPAIEFVCAQAQIGLDEIGAVAVDVGPGLFTGMRVGLASAKAIAQARRLPMIGISSLDLLAFPVRHGTRPIVAIVDARKDEVFWSVYHPVPGGVQRITDPAVGSIDQVIADVVARRLDPLFVGDGAQRHRDRLLVDADGEVADQFLSHPSAAPLVQLAHAQALREEWVNPWEIQPLYLRLPDAQINWATRASARRVGAPEQP